MAFPVSNFEKLYFEILLTSVVYKPNCAFACQSLFSGAMLECTDMHAMGEGHGGHGPSPTSPECRAGNSPYLTTLAYCINSTCTEDVEMWKLEQFWAEQSTGDPAVQPKWSYQDTLNEMQGCDLPTKELEEDEIMEETVTFDPVAWEAFRGTMWSFENGETTHSRYTIVLIAVSFGTPIFFSALGYLPFMTGIIDKLKPRLVYPSMIGTYHVRALPFALGNAPTMGQGLYIALFIILNIILTAAGHTSFQNPMNMYYTSMWQEMMSQVAARTGALAFALAPLVVLFSGRNNLLLWLTNWSHSTYLLLHRWVARMFTLQVILHSILEYMLYKDMGTVESSQKEAYWIWGIVGTIACVIMVVISTLFFRRKSYELFLIFHIILAIFVIVGSWYHVEYRFERKWGYENWIYTACAVWFADRLLRVVRILKNGMRKSTVTQVTENIVRIDIKGPRWDVQPGKHTYAYFPTLTPLRPWENHPFSVIPTTLLRSRGHSLAASSSRGSQHSQSDIEKTGILTVVASAPSIETTSGVSLYVRKSTGLTRALSTNTSLTTLLDGPYPNNNHSAVLKTDKLLIIAGGIGITGSLPFISHHQNVKLFWSVKADAQGLVNDLEGVLSGLREKEVCVGGRIDLVRALEHEEESGWERVGVVVCGPGGMCDEVRALVARKGRSGRVVWELDVEAFSW
jgi:predicted ferric reductase